MFDSKNKNIRNPVAYFKKVVKNMDNREFSKRIEIDDYEELSSEIEYLYYSVDEYFCGNNLLEWIELVENIELHKALKSLSLEEQTLLSYIYSEEKTQSEVARIYKVRRQRINEKISKIIYEIKIQLCKK